MRLQGFDDKEYKLEKDMCVISDRKGVLGLGGIIGGKRPELNLVLQIFY